VTGSPGILRWIARTAAVSPAAGAHLAVRCAGFTRFERLERALPRSGRILDVGCGHGLFALLAASRASGREVLGIDLLEERLEVARRVATRHGVRNVWFERRSALDLPAGRFDAVVIADVLMYLPPDSQRLVILGAASRLAPGGVLVVKEQVQAPAWKARMVAMQERLAYALRVRLGFFRGWGTVATPAVHLWKSDDLVALFRSLGLEAREERLDRFSYLSHHLFVGVSVTATETGVSVAVTETLPGRNAIGEHAPPGR